MFYSQILEKVKIAYDIPIVTDVHETIQVKCLVLLYIQYTIVSLIFIFVCLVMLYGIHISWPSCMGQGSLTVLTLFGISIKLVWS